MKKFLLFILILVVVAVTVLLLTNHAYVELPSAIAATHTMAIAAISCFFNVFTFIFLSPFFNYLPVSSPLSGFPLSSAVFTGILTRTSIQTFVSLLFNHQITPPLGPA